MALTITDDYYFGFIDGEGCFYVGIVQSPDTQNGWQVAPFFKVSQNPSGKVILDGLKKRLECGYVKQNDSETSTDRSIAFVVRDLNDLATKVIPFLEGGLITKRNTLVKFKKCVEYMLARRHLSQDGFNEIVEIAYSMSTQKRHFTKEFVLKSAMQKKSSQTIRQTPRSTSG